MVRAAGLVAALVALAALGGGPAFAATTPGGAAAAVSLHDLTGAACRIEPRTDIAPDPTAPKPVDLLCGAGKRPTGAVGATMLPPALPASVAARHALFDKLAAESPAGRDAAARMTCGPGRWTRTADGIELSVRACSLIDGGWPQILVVASLGQYLFEADGLPAMLPVFEAAMADQADYAPPAGAPAFGGITGARAIVERAFGPNHRMIGSDALDRYAALVEAARLYSSRHDFPAAENDYRQALDLQERAFGGNNIGVATTLLNLAVTVSNEGRFDEAAGLFRRADPIVAAANNPLYRARGFEYLGFDAANRGKFADGLRYARAAIGIWRQMIGSNTPDVEQLTGGSEVRAALEGELAHSLNLAAAMAWRVGNTTYAEGAAKEALGIVGRDPNLPPWWGPDILLTLGDVFAREGRLREAEESLRGALIFNERLFGNSAPTAIALLAIGRVYTADKLYDESLRAFQYALKIMAANQTARSLLVFDQVAPLITTINALAERRPDGRAALDATLFRALQYLSAGVADQTIARASARLASGNPKIDKLVNDLQEAERRRDTARLTLAYQSSLPQDQRGGDRERALLQEENAAAARVAALNARLVKEFPAYSLLSSPSPVPLAQLQRRLRAGEAVVEFAFGRDRAGVVLVTAHDFAARLVASNQSEIAAAVGRMRRVLDVRNARINDFDTADAWRLYRALFGPVASQLGGIDRLIVVPGDALASLPLALLVTAPPRGDHDYRDAAWLARRYAESVVPSVRAFVTLRDKAASATQAPQPFLGIGDPAFEGARAGRGAQSGLAALDGACRGNGPLPAAYLRALPPLPETAKEVEAVAHILGAGPGDVLTGSAATETAFRREPLSRFRVLYFATHGLLPGELDCATQPALALSPPPVPATTKAADGLLEAGEIAGLRLDADLVVLSACDTAETNGKFGGEALAGVAQAFFYAGARTLVATHWPIPSVPTVALMEGMFRRLGAGTDTAEALRQSQLALIAQPATANPFYWAAFTVMGDGDSRALPGASVRSEASLSHREMAQ